ncbi:MAG: DNA polymerase III subunit delta [Lentisphaerae bacterium]|nr:DNA polymerase III subunit delta [Lentisphaerota bacterium]
MTAKRTNKTGDRPSPSRSQPSTYQQTWLIVDNDDFLAEQRARAKINQWLTPEAQPFGLETFPGTAATIAEAGTVLRALLAGLRAPDLFAARRVLWWRNAAMLDNGTLLRNREIKALLAELAQAAAALPPELFLIITAPAADDKWTLARNCKQNDTLIQAKPVKPWNRDNLAAGFAEQALRQAGLKANRDVINALVARVGTDTRNMQQEITKLDIYLGERRTVTVADIEAIVSPGRDFFVWDLEDAVADRALVKALTILRRLLFQKEDPIRLVNSLDIRFRNMLILRAAVDQGWLKPPDPGRRFSAGGTLHPQLQEALSVDRRLLNPYLRDMLLQRAVHFSVPELVAARQLTLQVREQLVSSSLPGALLMERLLIRLCRKRRTA